MKKVIKSIGKHIELNVFDIGARGGVFDDLQELGSVISMFGFEPDIVECERLNNNFENTFGFKSLKYMPYALGKYEENINLNLYSHRGCSSNLKVNMSLANEFSRGDYFTKEGEFNMPVHSMDYLVRNGSLPAPDFIKIDVQGMEMDVFNGGVENFENCIGVRTEVYFRKLYENQPLFPDIDIFMRSIGMIPIMFLEFHSWRRTTKKKYPKLASGKMAFSRGEMMHSDILYLKDPEYLKSDSIEQIKKCIKAALVGIAYKQYDYSFNILSKKEIREFFIGRTTLDPVEMIYKLSTSMKIRTIYDRILLRLRIQNLKGLI